MDIETKEAVLKLAGYEVKKMRGGKSPKGTYWQVWDLSIGMSKEVAINLAYNTFLTRQNEVIES